MCLPIVASFTDTHAYESIKPTWDSLFLVHPLGSLHEHAATSQNALRLGAPQVLIDDVLRETLLPGVVVLLNPVECACSIVGNPRNLLLVHVVDSCEASMHLVKVDERPGRPVLKRLVVTPTHRRVVLRIPTLICGRRGRWPQAVNHCLIDVELPNSGAWNDLARTALKLRLIGNHRLTRDELHLDVWSGNLKPSVGVAWILLAHRLPCVEGALAC